MWRKRSRRRNENEDFFSFFQTTQEIFTRHIPLLLWTLSVNDESAQPTTGTQRSVNYPNSFLSNRVRPEGEADSIYAASRSARLFCASRWGEPRTREIENQKIISLSSPLF